MERASDYGRGQNRFKTSTPSCACWSGERQGAYCELDGMTINGLLVTKLLATYEQVKRQAGQNSKSAVD
jgi:hypothetical protein